MVVPFRGEGKAYAGPDHDWVSVHEFARLGLVRYTVGHPDSSYSTVTLSAPETFRRAITAIALHLADIGR